MMTATDVLVAARADRSLQKRKGGWRVVAAKEFADHVLSVRFTIVVLIIALAVIASVYAASNGIRESIERTSDIPTLFLRLFTTAPEGNRLPTFVGLVTFLAPLLGIAFGFDSVNGERSQGTLPRLLSQPIYRDDLINGKFVSGLMAIGLVIGTLTLIVAGIGMFRIGVVPTLPEIARLAAFLVVTMAYVGFWLALATLFSVVFRAAATSALSSIAAWLIATVFAGLLIGFMADVIAPVDENSLVEENIRHAKTQVALSRVLPNELYAESTFVLLSPESRPGIPSLSQFQQLQRAVPGKTSLDQSLLVVWPQTTAILAATILCFAAAYAAFMRQEVRA